MKSFNQIIQINETTTYESILTIERYNKVAQIFTSSLEIIVQLSEIKYEKGRFYKEDQTFQIDIIPI